MLLPFCSREGRGRGCGVRGSRPWLSRFGRFGRLGWQAAVAALLWQGPIGGEGGILAAAETTVRDFRIGWVLANPDGACVRPTIGVNGVWPPPVLMAAVGDRLLLNVYNELGNASTSLHFHGLFQKGRNHMDGAAGVTQCAIPAGASFTYEIQFDQAGTYWYHAHDAGQYLDGLRGSVVVHDPAGPYEGQYDEAIVLSVSDWYHRPSAALAARLISVENPTGAEPVPQAALINDTQDLRIAVQPGRTYLVRLVNLGGFASQYVWFEGHSMRVVEVDGVWTQPAPADRLYVAPAQRYSVLLTTRAAGADADPLQNFAVVSAMDTQLFDDVPERLRANATAWLVYDSAKPLPAPRPVAHLQALDDLALVPHDGQPLLEPVDHRLRLDVQMANLGDGANYAFFNGSTYVAPKVPSLYTALSVGGAANASSPVVYGSHTNTHVLRHNDVVELVLNNGDDNRHPFHLHGHNFQVVQRSPKDAGVYDDGMYGGTYESENGATVAAPGVPIRRDTLVVEANGHFVVRFRADNPGVWLFHCHIEWHMDQGLVATFVEAPAELPALLAAAPLPANHWAACRAAGQPTAGNAAGNVHDVFDLSGENAPPSPLPAGFTAKGYVALFFSCAAAVLGMAVITWYGLIDANGQERAAEQEPLMTGQGEED